MNGRILDLHVCVQGRPLPEYHHDGATWIEGRSGSDYVLRLRNRTGKRVEAVVTVDGVNVVNAEEGSAAGTGYVLGPYQTTDIKGFLRDAAHAAAFTFGAGGDAYRAKLGRDVAHIGAIGAAVFEEKVPRVSYTALPKVYIPVYPSIPWQYPYYPPAYIGGGFGLRGDTTGTSPPGSSEVQCSVGSAQAMDVGGSKTAQNLGTAYGREVDFSTTTTSFERATEHPVESFTIRYDDAEGLRRRGVPVGAVRPTPAAPSAFPADQVAGCPAPEGWHPA